MNKTKVNLRAVTAARSRQLQNPTHPPPHSMLAEIFSPNWIKSFDLATSLLEKQRTG